MLKIVKVKKIAKFNNKVVRIISSTPSRAQRDAEDWMAYRKTPDATVYQFNRGNRGCLLYVEEEQ